MPRKSESLGHRFKLPPKPSTKAAPEERVATFIEPARSMQALMVDPNAAPPPRKSSKLRRTQVGERVVAYVPPELAQALRMKCTEDRRSLSDAVTEAIRLLLKK